MRTKDPDKQHRIKAAMIRLILREGINGTSVSDTRDLHICNIRVTEDMDGATLLASYAADTPEPPKEKFGTTIAIGVLAVTIALIAMIYVVLQVRRY